jgi:hypothetical protein
MNRIQVTIRRACALLTCLCASSIANAVVIGFDDDPLGNPIGHGVIIADQYDSIGVNFTGGFRTGNKELAYPTYSANFSRNYLCTAIGASDPSRVELCAGAPPTGTLLGVIFDFDIKSASFEGYTRNDGPFDSDLLIMTAYDIDGMIVASHTAACNNNPGPPHLTEGICTASVVGAGIRRLEINPFDQDALDTLTFEISEVPVPEPGTLALLAAFLLVLGVQLRMRAKKS